MGIKSIQFGILDPKFIEKYSVCEVVSGAQDSNVEDRGLNSTRMGPVVCHEIEKECALDHLDNLNCPGHFGHIKLARPVYHIGFIETVKRVLACIDYVDSTRLIDETSKSRLKSIPFEKGEKRLNRVETMSRYFKRKRSSPKRNTQPKDRIDPESGVRIKMEFPVVKKKNSEINENQEMSGMLSPMTALALLKRINEIDIRILGFDPMLVRPEWMVITLLPIPPPIMRPSVNSEISTHEDDLTTVLKEIIKKNHEMKNLDKAGISDACEDKFVDMELTISQYFMNSNQKMK